MPGKILVKTPRGLERVAASVIEEVLGESVKVRPLPRGFKGLVIVEVKGSPEKAATIIEREVLEAEKVLMVMAEVDSDLDEIARAAADVARGRISESETFAVRTTRRGRHDFTSIDVNVRAGAAVQEEVGAPVNLTYPDKIVWVEVLDEKTFISITSGAEEKKKTYPGKPNVLGILRKIRVVQMPYTGPVEAAYKIGVRIGRAAQTFELRELVVAPFKPVNAREMAAFLKGVFEGIDSRYKIQRKTYAHKVVKVPVVIQDMYQFVRDHRGEPIVATSTRGRVITEVSREVREVVEGSKVVNVLIGAREGIPTGILKRATLTVDVAPGITLATDLALTSIITALVNAVLVGEEKD